MNTYYIVRYGSQYPEVYLTGAIGKFSSLYRAEVAVINTLGTEMNDGDVIGYCQIIEITDGNETLVEEFEY